MRLLAAAAAVALVAGCGGGSSRMSKADYEQKIQADGKAVQKAVSKINGSASLGSLATQIGSAEQAVKAAADDLDSIKPPQDAEADNKTIVLALRTIDTQLVRLHAAAKRSDIAGAQAAGAAIQNAPEVKAAQRAAKDLKQKGYKIGVLGQT